MSNICLTKACNITTGKLDANAATKDGKYPYFTCSEYPSKINTYAFEEDAILLAGNNAAGNFHCQRYNGRFNAYQRTYVITAKKGFDIDYIYYNLKINLLLFKRRSQGSQTKFLTMKNLDQFEIKYLQLEEQKQIVSILKTIDSKIALNNRINSTLESMAKTLYDYWFLQFDFPDENGRPYKSSGGKIVWNDELKREIPEGWEVKNVLDVIKWEGTSQPPKSTFKYKPEDGYVRFIQNRDYDNNTHLTYIPKDKSTALCTRYDIMIDKYGDAGRTRFGIEGAYNVALSKISPFNPILLEYIRGYFQQNFIYKYLNHASIASTRASLNESNLAFLKIVIPPIDIIKKFNCIANKQIEMLLKKKDENQKLAELRDFLLPLLMNGQVGFKEE